MKITKEEILEFAELLEEAESFRPLVKMVLDTLKSFGPELRELPEALCDWVVKNRISSIKKYEDAGFNREDAMIMTLDDIYGLHKLSQRTSRSSKKG